MTAWSPLRFPTFRGLWLAQLAVQIGGFMQMVGAVWLMGTLGGGPTLVALVQTAMSIPVFLFSLPAGALADRVDRRRFILAMQIVMCGLAASLAVLTRADLVTPVLLLAITFALAGSHAFMLPAWAAIQPDLVPRAHFSQAVTLASAGQNLGRVVGPAIGGAILALAGTETVFVLNAVSFLGVMWVLLRWRSAPERRETAPEPFADAIRSGARYARYSASLRGVLIRVTALCAPASATMALLPLVARDELALGASGYGLLMACYGLGAVTATLVIPRVRARSGADGTVLLGVMALTLNVLSLAFVRSVPVLAVTLVIGGAGWLMTLSTLNVAAQTALPAWVRARGLGFFFLAFQGSFGIGSAVLGALAGRAGLTAAFVVAGIGLLLGLVVTRRFALARIDLLQLEPAAALPLPAGPHPEHGPIVVRVEYRVAGAREREFDAAVRRAGRMRRRVGYDAWALRRDAADPCRFVETYRAASWEHHLRARSRMTVTDAGMERALDEFVVTPDASRSPYTVGYEVGMLQP